MNMLTRLALPVAAAILFIGADVSAFAQSRENLVPTIAVPPVNHVISRRR